MACETGEMRFFPTSTDGASLRSRAKPHPTTRSRGVAALCCVGVLLWGLTAVASASAANAEAVSNTLEGALAIQGLPSAAEQLQAYEQTRRLTPEAFAAREVSQTAFERLDPAQAKQLSAAAFPQLIEEPAGGPPPLPTGEKITAYESDYSAQLALPEHGRAVIESASPIARETSPGRREPIDLHLTEAEGVFTPATPGVAIHIPKRLADGTALGRTGVSVAPSDSSGAPLAGPAGELDGTSVLYPNVLTDTDTLIKPTTLGVSVETLLRSEQSPRTLYFHVGLPAGAKLVARSDGSEGIDVVDEGSVIATIAAPAATDAEETAVPATTSVSGDVLAVTLPDPSQYRLPIVVDPTVTDTIWQNEFYYSTYYHTNWTFVHSEPHVYFTAPEHPEGGKWTESINEHHSESEWGGLAYTTRGESQIVSSHVEGEWKDANAKIQNQVVLYTSKSPWTEDYDLLPVETEVGRGFGGYACEPSLKCPETTAGPAAPENGNTAEYQQVSTGSGATKPGTNTVLGARVTISQEHGPEISFNKTSPTLENEETHEVSTNVLYGSGGWLGPHSGAFEVKAADPGLGLELYRVLTGGWGDWRFYYADGECVGVQCPPYRNQKYNYKAGMPNGEPGFEAFTIDPVGLYADVYPQVIKVDAAPPHEIKLTGLQNGSELPLGESKLKVEATDGSGTTKSSGLKSITIKVDGAAVAASGASCSPGPCGATTEFTLAARNFQPGQHALVVTATDNANNVVQEEFTFKVHGANAVSVGPGSVDPSTGQLTVGATDVAPSGGVGISRTYESRELSAGAEGPLGPQWQMSMGGDEKLTITLSGNAVLSAHGGAETTFIRNESGQFESPPGDSNLKLEAIEKEPGKGVSEYVLKDEKAGTETHFAPPVGAQSTPPNYLTEFGTEARLAQPVSAALDAGGSIWATSYASDLIEKFSRTGALLATYGSGGTAGAQYASPWGIAVNQSSGNVYVSDLANNRIQELSSSGAFVRTFGWGVKDGSAEFETCTTAETCRPGVAGSGAGQFNAPHGLAIDASGNVWVADCNNNRLEEFSATGAYERQVGSAGSGSGQLSCPGGIAISAGNLYVADYSNNRIAEFSGTGTFIKAFGWGVADGKSELESCTSSCKAGLSGSGAGELNGPNELGSEPGSGNLYVADKNNNRVVEFSPSGSFLESFGSYSVSGEGPHFGGGGPQDVAVSASGVIYVTDTGNNRLKAWARPSWYPTESTGALAASTTNVSYEAVERKGETAVEPLEALSPAPVGVSCGKTIAELKRGCRALSFNYAESTTATGENESQWGDYKGNLTRVYYHAWDPVKGEMTEPVVAQYLYDKTGHLRAEWDPRIEKSTDCGGSCSALKTVYGYDSEGHLTSISSPSQEPWLFSYGTIEGDPSTGRLLAATRPSASTALGGGEAPAVTTKPSLSAAEAQVGVAISINRGSWSGSPLAYAYQWYTVRSGSCEPIQGAVNQTYTPLTRDRGNELYATVTAVNRAGATKKSTGTALCQIGAVKVGGTGELSTEPKPAPPEVGSNSVTTLEYAIPTSGSELATLTSSEAAKWGQTDDPTEGVAVFPPDEPMGWPAKDYKRATVHYWDNQGRLVNTVLPTPAGSTRSIATTEYNETNDVVRTLSSDNRATAMGEGTKSAEASKLLDTQSKYSSDGSELLQTIGPEHKVKLSSGAEVGARHVVNYHYDEGAPGGAHFGLVTKQTDGALVAGKEEDVRTTLTSYSGQEGLGWILRKPTSTTTDPAGLDLVHKTIYDPTTGNVTETRSPAGNSETIYPFAFSSVFGSEGTGNGQFKHPAGSAIDAAGNVWVVDEGNNRIEKLSPSGAFIAAYGKEGTGELQFHSPWGIAINQSTGNVYVADKGNNRIEELTSSDAFVAAFGTSGSGTLKEPTGVAVDSEGHVWVSDWGHNRLVEFSAEGVFIREAGSSGSGAGQINGPGGLALSEGSVDVADYYNNRVDQFSASSGASLGQFGSSGSGNGQFKEPYAVAANPTTGTLYVSDFNNGRIQELSPAGRYLTSWQTWGPSHRLSSPTGISIAVTGKLYASDLSANQVTVWTPPEAGAAHLTFGSQFGNSGPSESQLSTPINTAIDGEGNIWVTDCGHNRVAKYSAKGSFIAAYGKEGSGNGEYHCPGGIDINQSTGDVYVADTNGARIEELSSTGSFIRVFGIEGLGKLSKPGSIKLDSSGNVWVPDMSADRIVEFSATGTYIAAYGKEGTGEVQFKQPTGIAFVGEYVYVADSRNHRVQELTNKGVFIREFGKEGEGGGELEDPEGIATDAAGHLYVVDAGASHVEEFTSSGGYTATFATKGSAEGQLKAPIGDAIDAAGDLYVVDTQDNRVEKYNNANQAVHDTKTIYYSVGTEASVEACRNHPEWADMPCETVPVAQPSTTPAPNLPETRATYNVWGDPETVIETFGPVVRTKKETFDAAGRAISSEVSASGVSPGEDTPLPSTTNEYNAQTGALEKQNAPIEGSTKTITSVLNKLGALEKYTDADGVTSTYHYDVDGRIQELNYGTVDGETASQIYAYDATTGTLMSLYDTTAGTFTAKYDPEGKLASESYPNGMTATFTRNQAGEEVGLEYVKITHCSEHCTWFSDAVTPSIHGDTMKQASTLSEETSYNYNSVGELTSIQEVPAGKGCVTREYAYDEEGDRTRQISHEPGIHGECSKEGGSSEAHVYDAADRLSDAGVSYDKLGNATALPAADAGGHELKTSYFVDDQVSRQEQEEAGKLKTLTLGYDPAGRMRQTTTSGLGTVVTHYAGAGEAPSWSSEGSANWTRSIPGIDGTLCATQASGQSPVLQLHDLKGDIVATASLSETETKLISTYNSTEFGVPGSGTLAPRYAWLGAGALSTELPSAGIVTTGASSYVPEIGRVLQTEAVASPGSFPDGTGAAGVVQATYLEAAAQQFKAIALEQEAAQETAARREAEEAASWEECPASECHVDGPGEGNCEVNCAEEVEDPSVLLTVSESFAVAALFREGGNIAEGLSHLKIPNLVSTLIQALAELAQPALSGLAGGLEACYLTLSETGPESGRCKLWANLALNFPPVEVGTEICWLKEEKKKGKIHRSYPYCGDEYVWP